jgi:hypothetical protein
MADKRAASAPWQDLERQAYHAFREWPVWLALRERELAERAPERGASSATDVGMPPENQAKKKDMNR